MAKCPKCGKRHKEVKHLLGEIFTYTCPKKHVWTGFEESREIMGPEEYRDFKSRLRPLGDIMKDIV
jgi:hypothetical protein